MGDEMFKIGTVERQLHETDDQRRDRALVMAGSTTANPTA
jgi:hypothetical protein